MAASLFELARTMFRSQEPAPVLRAPRKVPKPHHAVVVVPGRHACAEVYALRSRRFLSREAPVLPLPGCGSARCECRYEHHDDRRKGLRRARDLAVAIDGHDGEELRDRSKRGRRKDDGR